jgi:hypothetical protein
MKYIKCSIYVFKIFSLGRISIYVGNILNGTVKGKSQVNSNPEPATKCMHQGHNRNAKAKEVCDIIVTQMKGSKEKSHTQPFALVQLWHVKNIFLLNS